MFEHDDKHVFSQLDRLHNAIESNLRSILPLMIVPDNDLVAGRGKHKDDEVCLVHHLDYLYRLVEVLYLLLDLVTAGVVLNDLKASLSGDCKVLLALI